MQQCCKLPSNIKSTLITGINQSSTNAPTYNVIWDEIGLNPVTPAQYSSTGHFKFNFNYAVMSNLTPFANKGDMGYGTEFLAFFDDANAILLEAYNQEGEATDGGLNGCSLLVIYNPDYVAIP